MALLELEKVSVNYGAVKAVRSIDLAVEAGEIVTLIGANGAGKSTILRAVSRLLKVREGHIRFDGKEITGSAPDAVVRLGIAQTPEGRQVLALQSVQDNLELGAYVRRDRAAIKDDIARMYSLFPTLRERRNQPAGTLSGGEQQMLAIARSLMSRPQAAAARRAEPGPGAAHRARDILDHPEPECRRGDHTTGRAECQAGHAALQPHVRARCGPDHLLRPVEGSAGG